MRIEDAWSTTSVEIEPIGYQFPDYKPRTGEMYDEWDANWLVIRGRVTAPEISWSFTDPCLTAAEAAELRDWLRHVADGQIPPFRGVGLPGRIYFTEPNMSVTLGDRDNGLATLQWHFSQESSPPGSSDEVRFGDGHPVQTVLSASDLTRAADEWAAEVGRFPNRSGRKPPW